MQDCRAPDSLFTLKKDGFMSFYKNVVDIISEIGYHLGCVLLGHPDIFPVYSGMIWQVYLTDTL